MKLTILVSMMLLQVFSASTRTSTTAFCPQQVPTRSFQSTSRVCVRSIDDDGDCNNYGENSDTPTPKPVISSNRRSFVTAATTGAISIAASASVLISSPQSAFAGIDVSGLRQEGGGGNSILQDQLKAIDGSASNRINQIKEISASSAASSGPKLANGIPIKIEEEVDSSIATWLFRSNPAMSPSLSRSGAFKNLFRCDDNMVGPSSSNSAVGITFEFPSDWLQLDRVLGGISYVDQRNGDRLYVLKTRLPEGEQLSTIPKAFFGTSIFDPKGTFLRSQGTEVDEYKVSSAQTLNECPNNMCATHKRFKIKYTTVTGNGLRVERRALVDAYEMNQKGDVYMLMTSSNAVKFDLKDSPERQTVEGIVDSFRVNV